VEQVRVQAKDLGFEGIVQMMAKTVFREMRQVETVKKLKLIVVDTVWNEVITLQNHHLAFVHA